jgi:hypothetical protein
MNIHPDDGHKWKKPVSVRIQGDGEGNCVILDLDKCHIAIHYGDSECQDEFVRQLKEAVNKLE